MELAIHSVEKLDIDLLVEAYEGIINDRDMELVLANSTLLRLHLKLGHRLVAFDSFYALNLQNSVSCLRINDDYIPMGLL